MKAKPVLTVKQAKERGIVTSYINLYGVRRWQADLCGEQSFESAGKAVAAYVQKCQALNRAP